MIKVSVIVPVYNTSKYLEKCIDSLINQTLKEIEIIVINDGSTDTSDTIMQKYLSNKKIHLIFLFVIYKDNNNINYKQIFFHYYLYV